MGKVISLDSKIKEKVKQDNLNKNGITKKTINLNKRKTITLSTEEIVLLIEISLDYLNDMPNEINDRLFFIKEEAGMYANSLLENDEETDVNEDSIKQELNNEIKVCKKEIQLILRNTKKLIDKYFSSKDILDKKVQFSGRDIGIYYEILAKYVDVYVPFRMGFDELHKKTYYKKDYDTASENEKMIKYLYKIFRDMYLAFHPSNTDFSDEAINKSKILKRIKEQRDSFDGILEYYKDSYIKEYKSKVTIVCEGYWSLTVNDETVGSSDVYYYIKPHAKINRRLAKYNRWDYIDYKNPTPFEYIDECDLEMQNELYGKNDNYPYGIGWRISHEALSMEEFEENDDYEYCYELYEAQREVSKEKFSKLKEFEGLDIEILFDEDLEEKYYDMPVRTEKMLDSLEYIFDDYFSCEYIRDDAKIFHMLEEITDCFYE